MIQGLRPGQLDLRVVVGIAAVGVCLFLPFAGLAPESRAAATPAFVQGGSRQINSGTTNTLSFNSANTAGNLVVVYAVWSNTSSVTITDSRGNVYASVAARATWNGSWSSQTFYAQNVAGGSNAVTERFANGVNSFGILYIHEYSGIDKAAPLDVTIGATGTSSAMSSGSVTTTNASDLLFGGGASKTRVTQGGS